MNSLRRIRLSDGSLLRLVAVGSASAAASSAVYYGRSSGPLPSKDACVSSITTNRSQLYWRASIAECEELEGKAKDHSARNRVPVTRPSWMRRTLGHFHLRSLPMPRLLAKGDPAFRLDQRLLQKRQDDEMKMQGLVRGAVQERNPETLKALNEECLWLAYGEGVTLKNRQDFVHRHGCTAWTNDVLDAIVELGNERGIVEIGAGNGQWARALTERYKTSLQEGIHPPPKNKKFDFVLAYDDQSELPLDQQVFNKRTKIHHDFFYDKVKACDPNNFSNTLRQWQCRGRILLLVYPPQGKMAMDAVEQYASASDMNDTVVYVGEGRGGVNANDDLFDHFESRGWVLMRVIKVKSLGSKGYEKLYILRRQGSNV